MIYSMEYHQSSYYSVSHGPTALKIYHYTVHQKVGEKHTWQESSKFKSFAIKSDLVKGKQSK